MSEEVLHNQGNSQHILNSANRAQDDSKKILTKHDNENDVYQDININYSLKKVEMFFACQHIIYAFITFQLAHFEKIEKKSETWNRFKKTKKNTKYDH